MAGLNNKVKITNDIELKDRLVAINRVTKVTKGGRTFTFSAIVVVGNEDGIIGWGLGKAGEVTAAIAKGVESAKKNLINAVTNTKYDSHYVDNYSNEPLYYREVESLYEYSGCGHCFTAIRVETLGEVSNEDAYKWDRKHSKHWYQNYNWDTDEYELNGLFGLFCIAISILVSIVFGAIATLWEEKHPEPPVEFKYNLEIGQYEINEYRSEDGHF